jgi:hypothetical protein
MNRFRIDLPEDVRPLLDRLCGRNGEKYTGCLVRLIAYGIKTLELFDERAKYQDIIDRWGEPTRRMVKK